MIVEFRLADMKRLHGNKGLQHDLVADHHLVADRSELVERLHDEPGAFAARIVQIHTHGVFLDMRGQFLVDSQVFIALEMEQLNDRTVLYERVKIDQFGRLCFVLFLLQLGRMLFILLFILTCSINK